MRENVEQWKIGMVVIMSGIILGVLFGLIYSPEEVEAVLYKIYDQAGDSSWDGYIARGILVFPNTFAQTNNPSGAIKIGREDVDFPAASRIKYRGGINWLTGPIPDACIIQNITLTLFVQGLSGSSPCNNDYIEFRALELNETDYPNTGDGRKLYWQDMGNGTLYLNSTPITDDSFTGYVVFHLGNSAFVDMTEFLSKDWFGVGMRSDEQGQGCGQSLNVSGYSASDGNYPSLNVTYTCPGSLYGNATSTIVLNGTGRIVG